MRLKPRFENQDTGPLSLKCPSCGNDNLHQIKTEVFERCEDVIKEAEVKHITITRREVTTDADFSRCPSPRRHGLLIDFNCEHCPYISTLAIYQHKGSTYFEWVESRFINSNDVLAVDVDYD